MALSTKELRKMLKAGCKNLLLPHLADHGFHKALKREDDPTWSPTAIWPYGKLERRRNGYREIIEIQFDKNSYPAIRLSFGKIPEAGIESQSESFVDADFASSANLPIYYDLYSSRYFKRWFKLGLFTPKTKKSMDQLIHQIVRFSDEIILWFDTGKLGKHVRVVDRSTK